MKRNIIRWAKLTRAMQQKSNYALITSRYDAYFLLLLSFPSFVATARESGAKSPCNGSLFCFLRGHQRVWRVQCAWGHLINCWTLTVPRGGNESVLSTIWSEDSSRRLWNCCSCWTVTEPAVNTHARLFSPACIKPKFILSCVLEMKSFNVLTETSCWGAPEKVLFYVAWKVFFWQQLIIGTSVRQLETGSLDLCRRPRRRWRPSTLLLACANPPLTTVLCSKL